MIIRFVEEFHTTRLSQLSKRFNEAGIPAFTLLNKNAGDAVSHFELLPLMLETVNLFEDDIVCWKIAFPRCSFKDLSVQFIVKI